MRIAVTGSSGRVGAVVVRHLQEHGHAVLCIDVRPSTDAALPPTRVVDLSRIEQVQPAFDGVDAVCHLGNYPGFWRLPSPADGYINNAASTFNVFLAAEAIGIKRVVYASSIQVYGVLTNNFEGPPRLSAPDYFPIDEDHPRRPCEAYPLSKAAGEQIAETFARRRADLAVYSLRLTAVRSGQGGRGKVYPLAGSLFTYIDPADAATAVRLCCEKQHNGHTALNIVAPKSFQPWSRAMIQQTYGATPEFRRPLTETDALVSGRRATEVLGFTPAAVEPPAREAPPQAAS